MRFFKSLLAPPTNLASGGPPEHDLLNNIPPIVSDVDNISLMAPLTIQELRKFVFSLPSDKSLGLDAYTTLFFQASWNFIGWELLDVIEEARKSKAMLKYFNTTNIIIIPKIKSPKNFADFC